MSESCQHEYLALYPLALFALVIPSVITWAALEVAAIAVADRVIWDIGHGEYAWRVRTSSKLRIWECMCGKTHRYNWRADYLECKSCGAGSELCIDGRWSQMSYLPRGAVFDA